MEHAYCKYGQLYQSRKSGIVTAVCILACKYERDKMQSRVFCTQVHNSSAKKTHNVQSKKHWGMYPRLRKESASKNNWGGGGGGSDLLEDSFLGI